MASCSIWEYWAGDCQRDQRRQVRHTYVIQLNTKGISTRGQLIISVTLYLEIYNKQTEHCWWQGPPHINKQYEIVLFIKISLFIQSWKCTEFVYLCINKSVYEALSLLIILSPQKLQNAPLITNFFLAKIPNISQFQLLLSVRTCCFSPFYININRIFLGFGRQQQDMMMSARALGNDPFVFLEKYPFKLLLIGI